MLKKKIYLAGSGGMLGEAFYKIFSSKFKLKCTDIDVNEKWLTYLDFRNYKQYYKDVVNFRADYLFHLGAYTDLEYCERNKKETYETNVKSVENAVAISNLLKIPLIYISTAGIYDGKKTFYNDLDIPRPLNQYGITKYLAERFIQINCRKYLICRAGWMMGGGPKKDKKFIQKIMLQIKNGAQDLFIVNDKLGTPTYTYDFAKNVKLLLEKETWGLYNMVCTGNTTRLNVARELCKILDLKKKIKINKVDSNYWKKIYFAKRPYSERLINKKLNTYKLNIMRNWKVCLKEYINSYYKNYI